MIIIPSENDEAMQLLFSEGAFMPKADQPTAIPFIIRRWRGVIEGRANLDGGPGDFLGRVMFDEIAQIDAWLKEQEGEVQP